MADVNFKHLEMLGEAAGQARFERFVIGLVSASRPEVLAIRAAPGDWGIDAGLGDLTEGVAVWQAKFFVREVGKTQRSEVKKSYDSARKQAELHDYALREWTLCIPIDLSPDEQRWWERFKRERKSEGVVFDLWTLARIERLLRRPEAADVRAEYFPHLDAVHPRSAPEIVEPDDGDHEHMLYIKQLRAGGIGDVRASREQFFNAEVLRRQLEDRRLERQLGALRSLRRDLFGQWSDRFNHHCGQGEPGNDRLPDLHADVMALIDAAHDANPNQPLPLHRTHRKGTMHQVVEEGEAGWCRSYEDIARSHRGD
jgi:hypothetical protein